jgi:hypothetical protein
MVNECSAGANDAVTGVEVPPQVFSCLNPRDEAQFADRFVNERLALWQHRLNLEDWHISVVMTRRSDLKPKTLGGIRWDKSKKSAVMEPQQRGACRQPDWGSTVKTRSAGSGDKRRIHY